MLQLTDILVVEIAASLPIVRNIVYKKIRLKTKVVK